MALITTTVEQLARWLRDAGVAPETRVVIQAYGKAAKHYDWAIDFFGGEVIITADLKPRAQRDRCPICGGAEFEPALDNHGDAYSGCVRCALKASEGASSATSRGQ
jgi:hypothetical protein